MPDLSVIICAHNPREDYLLRTLEALKAQTLPRQQWELLLIDNASREALSSRWDLSWHPNGRLMREEELGLTPARLRGIRESQADVLIFVDDDNVLANDYLWNALAIGQKLPCLGAWGGQKHPEFENPPPDWTRPYWRMLAIVEFEKDSWSNFPHGGSLPCGAGMCVRKSLAARYASLLHKNHLRGNLDRRGTSLMSGGDTDLVYSLYEVGYGSGLFTDLNLVHLIGKNRTTIEYLTRLCEAMTISDVFLDYFHNQQQKEQSFPMRLLRMCRALLRKDRTLKLAVLRGERRGRKMLRAMLSQDS